MTTIVPTLPGDAELEDQTWLKFRAWKLAQNYQLLTRYLIALWFARCPHPHKRA